VLKVHKHAIAEIKSAQQRVEKATEERDKLKGKLFPLMCALPGLWYFFLRIRELREAIVGK
jgi:hypothetical protein